MDLLRTKDHTNREYFARILVVSLVPEDLSEVGRSHQSRLHSQPVPTSQDLELSSLNLANCDFYTYQTGLDYASILRSLMWIGFNALQMIVVK